MIGRGGMGAVYKAHQKSLDRTVALKITSSEIYATEAQAAAHLDHPGIVPVFQVGNDSGRHFFTMGFVNGMSLEQMLKRGGPFKPKDAALTTAAIAGAIHYAHTRGVIHRDIKPANALIDDQGRPRVVDFGLAQRIRIGDAQTESDVIVGTPEYISPEVANGNPATPLSDVYSIGAMLYSLLVGRPPFTGIDIFDVLRRVRRYHPVPPRKANKSIPRDLETICLKCLAKYPPARYANAEELALDLTRWLNGVPVLARHRTRLERTYRLIRNNLLVTAALLVALIGICFAIGATLTNLIAEPGRPLITQAPGTRERTPEESPQPISDPHVLAKAIPLLQKDHPAAASAALIQMARLWPVQEPLPPDLYQFARDTAGRIVLPRSNSPLCAFAFGDDTSLAAVCADGQLTVWEPLNTAPPWTERLKTTLQAPVTAAAFNDRGTWLCTATQDHGITLSSLIPNVDSTTVTVPNLGSTVSRLVYVGMPILRPVDPNSAATTDTTPADSRLKPQEYFHGLAAFTESGVHLWNSLDNSVVGLEDKLSDITLHALFRVLAERRMTTSVSGAMANEHQNHCQATTWLPRKLRPIVTTKGDTFQLSTLTLGDLDSATTASTPAVITDLTPMLIYRAPLSIEMLNAIFGGTVPNRPDVPEPLTSLWPPPTTIPSRRVCCPVIYATATTFAVAA